MEKNREWSIWDIWFSKSISKAWEGFPQQSSDNSNVVDGDNGDNSNVVNGDNGDNGTITLKKGYRYQ